jgi:outer membrane protein
MKLMLITSTLFLSSVVWAGEPRSVSLKEALVLTDKNNSDLSAARASAAQVAAKARLAFSAILPDVSAGLAFVYTSAPAVIDNTGQTQLLTGLVLDSTIPGKESIAGELQKAPASIPIQARESLFGNLLIQQVLFSPQFFLLPAADESKEAARLGSLEAREQILLAVARVYLGVQGLSELEKAAKEAEGVALKRESEAKAQQAVGMATDIAVLRAQSETAQARSLLATLSGQRVGLISLLEALTGEAVKPTDAPTEISYEAQTEETTPWEKTYLVQANKMGAQSLSRFNTVDRLSFLPSIVGQAKLSYNSNKGFVNTNWIFDGTVAAQWSIYDRGYRYAQLHENDAKTAEAQAKARGAVDKAKAQWIAAKSNVGAAKIAHDQSVAQFQLATRAQAQIESAQKAGFVTNLEVTDIDNRKFLAASAAAQAKATLELRKLELAASEGRLAECFGL